MAPQYTQKSTPENRVGLHYTGFLLHRRGQPLADQPLTSKQNLPTAKISNKSAKSVSSLPRGLRSELIRFLRKRAHPGLGGASRSPRLAPARSRLVGLHRSQFQPRPQDSARIASDRRPMNRPRRKFPDPDNCRPIVAPAVDSRQGLRQLHDPDRGSPSSASSTRPDPCPHIINPTSAIRKSVGRFRLRHAAFTVCAGGGAAAERGTSAAA